jgi:undecaprenyl-diphosphatase
MTHGWTGPLDTAVRRAIQSWSAPGGDCFARWITGAGEFPWQLLLGAFAAVYLRLVTRRWRPPLLLLGNLGGVWLLNLVLKSLYQRARPTIHHLVEVGGYSFPSGHAMSTSAFYGMIGYLLWNAYRRKWRGAWVFPAGAVLLAATVGWSRVYLGVHFFTDVLAGYAAGGLWLLVCLALYEHRSDTSG